MRSAFCRFALCGLVFLAAAASASAAETVSIGGSQAVLLRPASPVASVILMAGGDGRIAAGPGGIIGRLKNNQLVRTREAYLARGLAVLVVDADVNLAKAVDYMAAIKRLVPTSGFLSAASGKPNENVEAILGTPDRLPKTLIIHHRQDECRFTQPAGVAPFIAWAGGKARVVWLDGGQAQGDPCQAKSHHGFLGLDGEVVAHAAAFR